MNREKTQELEELSLQVFGKRYEWRKLTRKGLVSDSEPTKGSRGRGFIHRRVPLSLEGAKSYMEKTLEMREKMKQEMEKQNDGDNGSMDK